MEENNFEMSSGNYDPAELTQQPVREPIQSAASIQNSLETQRRQEPHKKSVKPEKTTLKEKRKTDHTRWRLFAGVVLIVAALYLLIVSISYFAHGAADQSIVDGKNYAEIAAQSTRIENTGGPTGAYLSHMFVNRSLGVGSFIIIFFLAAFGLSLLHVKRFKLWSLTYKCLLCAITLSMLAGFVTYSLTSFNYWGGLHGHETNRFIMEHAGIWGAIGVNIILVAAVVLVFLREIQYAINIYRRRMEQYRAKLNAEREAAKERQRIMESQLTPSVPNEAESFATEAVQPISEENEITPETQPTETHEKISDELTPTTDIPTVETRQPEAISVIATENNPNENETKPAAAEIDEESITVEETDEEKEKDVDVTVTVAKEIEQADYITTEAFDPTAELSHFKFPDIGLLAARAQSTDHVDINEQEENKQRLTRTLETFGVKISKIEATIGPTITRYEIIPAEGVRTRSVKSLGEDLALALSALGIRIIAPIPGKGTIGIEVPNRKQQIVGLRNIITSEAYQNSKAELPIAIGTTITNDVYIADLAKLPHLLVAGATGTGKSVGLNTIIASLLYKKHPAELKFVLIDPKRVELSLYSKIENHYLASLPGEEAIIKDTDKVVTVLNSLCIEMGNRLNLLEEAGVRNIKEYNEKFIARKLDPRVHRFLPYIVLIIDEFADIILTAGREVENPVSRLAAVARAAGIHLIIATQRPTVNVITGGIKTNIPGRIAFRVNQGNDSKTILDTVGANQLVGMGDMLFSQNGVIERVQCAFIDTNEVKAICDSIGEQVGYGHPYELPEFVPQGNGESTGNTIDNRDPLFEEAARMVVESGRASTTELQRKLSIGFGRAGRIMDQLEQAGVVGPNQGSKPRAVLMDYIALDNYLSTQNS
ncbi:MAG: DNA translocase FtsK [Roseburia sp.]|nr:DNA translocase FtsK [Roseburia sp.]